MHENTHFECSVFHFNEKQNGKEADKVSDKRKRKMITEKKKKANFFLLLSNPTNVSINYIHRSHRKVYTLPISKRKKNTNGGK